MLGQSALQRIRLARVGPERCSVFQNIHARDVTAWGRHWSSETRPVRTLVSKIDDALGGGCTDHVLPYGHGGAYARSWQHRTPRGHFDDGGQRSAGCSISHERHMPDDRLLSGRRHYVPREIHHLTRLQLLI